MDPTPLQTISPPSGAIHWLWGRRGLGEELTTGRFGMVAGCILFATVWGENFLGVWKYECWSHGV